MLHSRQYLLFRLLMQMQPADTVTELQLPLPTGEHLLILINGHHLLPPLPLHADLQPEFILSPLPMRMDVQLPIPSRFNNMVRRMLWFMATLLFASEIILF